MKPSNNNEFFPIRKLAERTGVGPSTLRAWERRYSLLKPKRTPKGHRLYTEDDAQVVYRVLELLDDGHAISEAARRILSAQTETGSLRDTLGNIAADLPDDLVEGQWQGYLKRLLAAVESFNPQRLDAVYNEASSLYPLDLVSRYMIEPALKILGERWKEHSTGIAEEHFFSAWLRNKLGARLHHEAANVTGSTLVVCCVPGHRHEVGPLLFSLAALGRGYQVVYLGIDMPMEPIPEVVDRCKAKGVVLAGGREPDPDSTLIAIAALATRLSCPLFIGGPLSIRYKQALIDSGGIPIGVQFSPALHVVSSVLPAHQAERKYSDRPQ